MSLVGRLEDLGFGEILQILTISGKSGVLHLHQTSGSGARVYLTQGNIEGVLVEGGIETLAEVVLAAGALEKDRVESLHRDARERSVSFAALLCEHTELDEERLDSLLREVAEASVLSLFTWNEGKWTFDMSGQSIDELEAREMRLKVGLNAQFLALEGVRLLDEESQEDDDFAISFSGEAETLPDFPMPDFQEELVDGGPDEPGRPDETIPGFDGPLIAIDRDLDVLEWLKHALHGCAHFVHIFQSLEPAVERLRYYFVRGVTPGVILSQHLPECAEPNDGSTSAWEGVLTRLQAQGANLPMLLLCDPEVDSNVDLSPFFAVATRPDRSVLGEAQHKERRKALALELRAALGSRNDPATAAAAVEQTEPDAPAESVAPAPQPTESLSGPNEIERLHAFTSRLNAPESRGQVLELVLAFASEIFERVALFVFRDGRLCGLSQHGLEAAGGPDSAGFRNVDIDLSLRPDLAPILLESDAAIMKPPEELATAVGAEIAREAYWAPIRGGDSLAAVLYADNLPSGAPLPDTRSLEVGLHTAAIALERALLELVLEQES